MSTSISSGVGGIPGYNPPGNTGSGYQPPGVTTSAGGNPTNDSGGTTAALPPLVYNPQTGSYSQLTTGTATDPFSSLSTFAKLFKNIGPTGTTFGGSVPAFLDPMSLIGTDPSASLLQTPLFSGSNDLFAMAQGQGVGHTVASAGAADAAFNDNSFLTTLGAIVSQASDTLGKIGQTLASWFTPANAQMPVQAQTFSPTNPTPGLMPVQQGGAPFVAPSYDVLGLSKSVVSYAYDNSGVTHT